MPTSTDVLESAQMQAVAEAAVSTFGRLDVWVNNAGVMPLSPVALGRTEEWNRMVDVNVKGVLNGVAAAHPIMPPVIHLLPSILPQLLKVLCKEVRSRARSRSCFQKFK